MQARLTLSALSTWYVVTDLLSDSYRYLKQFSFTGRKAQESDRHERGSDSRNRSQSRRTAHQEDKPVREQAATHESDTGQTGEAGRKGGKTANQDREHMAEIGRKGGETISQDREHMAEIGHKGGETISQDREHMAEIGHKAHENAGSERRGQSRTKGRNRQQAESGS